MKMQLLVVFWQESSLLSAKDFRTDKKNETKGQKGHWLDSCTFGAR